MTVVTDSGPLIVLAKTSHLHLLPILYSEVIMPPAVYHWIHSDLCRRVRREILGE
jgi:predicted nucleic acid-binding protein